MLILTLVNVQNSDFSFEKGLNGQMHSYSESEHTSLVNFSQIWSLETSLEIMKPHIFFIGVLFLVYSLQKKKNGLYHFIFRPKNNQEMPKMFKNNASVIFVHFWVALT